MHAISRDQARGGRKTWRMTSCKRKRTDLSLSQKKLKIVQLSSEKVSQTHLAQKFGCSQSTISKILRQKDEIKQDATENKVKDRKRKRGGKDNDVEKSSLHFVYRCSCSRHADYDRNSGGES